MYGKYLLASELISGKTVSVPIRAVVASQPANLQQRVPHADRATDAPITAIGRAADAADAPIEARFGPHLKDVAVSGSGDLAVFNAMNWDQNLYAVDLKTGDVRWRRRLGHHFSYDPRSTASAFAVQAFDRTSAEGYHLYLLDPNGKPERRFALYGLPKRATTWDTGLYPADRIDQFAASPAGDWVASSGDLGVVVWDRDGRRRWSVDGWKTGERHITLLAAFDRETLVGVDSTTVTAYDARHGSRRWTIRLAATGHALGAVVGAPASKMLRFGPTQTGGKYFSFATGSSWRPFRRRRTTWRYRRTVSGWPSRRARRSNGTRTRAPWSGVSRATTCCTEPGTRPCSLFPNINAGYIRSTMCRAFSTFGSGRNATRIPSSWSLITITAPRSVGHGTNHLDGWPPASARLRAAHVAQVLFDRPSGRRSADGIQTTHLKTGLDPA